MEHLPVRLDHFVRSPIQSEHLLWWTSRMAAVTALVLLPVMIIRPGLYFWVDLLTVIPIMLMGGMCSEDMMTRMIYTAITFGLLCGFGALAMLLHRKLRHSFDAHARSRAVQFWTPPGPTVWQARLYTIKLGRARVRRQVRPFFHPA
ncbi:MAG: hypothetical protein OXC60_06760 [Litoreibacter sp.]|nr:hypothetical protein [Litoreibacter sp.]